MKKRLRGVAAVAALSLICLPLAACGTGGASTDVVEHGNPAPSAVVGNDGRDLPEGGSAAVETVGQDVVLPAADETEPVLPNVDPDPSEPTDGGDEWSKVYDNAYLWDGDLVKAGWADTDTNKAARPDTYVVNDETRTISICDASAFAFFAHQSNLPENNGFKDYTVVLDCDIDLGGDDNTWIPVGFISRKQSATENADGHTIMFKGTFDGNGHTIYNFSSKGFYDNIVYKTGAFYINVSETLDIPFSTDRSENVDEYVYGLFGSVGNAMFKNFNIVDIKIDLTEKSVDGHEILTDCVGAIVGFAAGDLTLTGCVAGSPEVDAVQAETDYIRHTSTTGGLVGRCYAGKLDGKPFAGSSLPKIAGGKTVAAGYRLGAVRMTDCVNHIDLGSDGEGEKKAGILGYIVNQSEFTFDNCKNHGNIYGALYAGGMLSYWQTDGSAERYEDAPDQKINHSYVFDGCVNYGNITSKVVNSGSNSLVGGIVGGVNDWIAAGSYDKNVGFYDCANYGDVAVFQPSYVGGIIGSLQVYAHTDDAADSVFRTELNGIFNYGDVAGYDGDGSADTAVGGVIGRLNLNNVTGERASNVLFACGNCGAVTGKNSGGCIGGVAALDGYTVKYLINAYKAD